MADEASGVLDPLFAGSVGRPISARAIREAFDARFGKGAGARVALTCKDASGQGAVAFEVRLSLPTVAELRQNSAPLGQALAAGPTVPPGCGQARVP